MSEFQDTVVEGCFEFGVFVDHFVYFLVHGVVQGDVSLVGFGDVVVQDGYFVVGLFDFVFQGLELVFEVEDFSVFLVVRVEA